MQRVALLGLGTMGAGMAANWLAKGFGLTVWNRTRTRTQALADKGARVATTPREAAEGADCVFAMVADDAASRAVWRGDANLGSSELLRLNRYVVSGRLLRRGGKLQFRGRRCGQRTDSGACGRRLGLLSDAEC